MLEEPGIDPSEECLALAVQEFPELRRCACVDAIVHRRALESRRTIGMSCQVVDIRCRDIGDDRTLQTNELRVHGLRNIDTLEWLKSSIRCFAYGSGSALSGESRGAHHSLRTAATARQM